MIKKILLVLSIFTSSLFAHSAVMTCFDNGDETISCEGGFSDGASGKGVTIFVKQNEKELFKDKMNENGEFTFKKPKGEYTVTFDAGKSHVVTINSKDIIE